jgi:hypothetical protein
MTSVMLSTEIFEMRKYIFTFSLAKTKWRAEEIFEKFSVVYLWRHALYLLFILQKNAKNSDAIA